MLGNNLKMLMLEKNISQKELAKKVGITEVSMSRYVNDERVPKGPLLVLIAKELNCTVEQLFKEPNKEKDIDVSDLNEKS